MTYEEALSHAKKEQEAYLHKVADGKAFYAKYAEFWKIVVSSIEKQIPKKPLPENYFLNYKWQMKCPSCGGWVMTSQEARMENCCNCGQRILWEDEE